MSTDAQPNAPGPNPQSPADPPRPPISPPMPDAEAKLRAIAEAQGVVLDGKAFERILAAGADFFDSAEEHEQFIELLQKIRKTP
jgi:hypothetical protein